jgi:anthranilate synthase/aminodeoxychorismate synthase-like glutamine amidotransferase
MILLVDNYDSFVHNLARYFRRLGHETLVVRNDRVDVETLDRQGIEAVVLSPGPGSPDQAGCCLELVRRWAPQLPILGVCLGHQVIGQVLGGRVVRAPQPMHGMSSLVEHEGEGLFVGLPNPLRVGRYHSLVVDPAKLVAELRVTARTDDGIVMAVQHAIWPLFGVQFHPESVLTEHGYEILASFLRHAGLSAVEPPRDECASIWWGSLPRTSVAPGNAALPGPAPGTPPAERKSPAARADGEQAWPAYPVRYRQETGEP